MLTDEVRLAFSAGRAESDAVTEWCFQLYRSEPAQGGTVEQQIGSGDYRACSMCRWVQLGEIGLLDWEQRRGLGRRTMTHLRTRLPGYRWLLTPMKRASEPFWHRLQSTYPDEYYDGRDPRGYPCHHMRAARGHE